ncbi:hypothetical protein NS2R_09595 [Pseudomonas oryzihabitans]|nr:hypothetical protein NS2R_09595 [Pseudomonas psychrotolerans]
MKKNNRILYVVGSLEVGGAERHIVRLVGLLRAKGWEPEIFTLALKGPLIQTVRELDIPVFGTTLPAWLKRCVSNDRARARILLLCTAMKLLYLLWRRRPAIVHFFLPAAYVIGGVVSLFSPVPKRIMSRRSMNNYQLLAPRQARLEKWLHKKMNVICGNSKLVVEQLANEGVDRDRLRLTYNGIECGEVQPDDVTLNLRKSLGISQDSIVMVIVANLIAYKGHADLIKALGLIKNELPVKWDLVCLGRNDGIEEGLLDEAKQLGIAEHIHFLGSRPDVSRLLGIADIGLLCSHEEGFSNAILECMAASLPMVVTDVGGNGEAVLNNVTGLVVPPRDPNKLGEALLQIVNNPNRAIMGQRGRLRVQKFFSMSACVDTYESIYRESLDS